MISLRSVLAIVLFSSIVISCEKEDKNPQKTETEAICAKWIVSNTSSYESFEFNKSGNFIVISNANLKSTEEQVILFGTYLMMNDSTIILSDFGTIEISSIDNATISFTLTPEGDDTSLVINATKAAEFEGTIRTIQLCRTWKLISINGVNVEGTADEMSMLFSKAGTYLVIRSNGAKLIAHWKWKNDSELTLCYSWDGPPLCNGEDEIEITELTAGLAKAVEIVDEVSYLYVFEPVRITK